MVRYSTKVKNLYTRIFFTLTLVFYAFVVACGLVKFTFSKQYFRNTFMSVKRFEPNQDRRSVGPDLGQNCLQELSVDDKRNHQSELQVSPLTLSETLEADIG